MLSQNIHSHVKNFQQVKGIERGSSFTEKLHILRQISFSYVYYGCLTNKPQDYNKQLTEA